MRLFSHIVAGIGAGSIASMLYGNHYGAFLYIVILSFVINIIIDLGHTRIRGIVIRSPYTHEALNSIVISILVGSIVWIAIGNLYGVSLHASLSASLLISGSHLLGDLITRGGIYVRIGANMLRISLADYSYKDPLANAIYVAILSLPLIISLAGIASSPSEIPWYSLVDKLVGIYGTAG
ncbi:MAG: DUF1286 domain-containing protein [Sulfolobales archaeon]